MSSFFTDFRTNMFIRANNWAETILKIPQVVREQTVTVIHPIEYKTKSRGWLYGKEIVDDISIPVDSSNAIEICYCNWLYNYEQLENMMGRLSNSFDDPLDMNLADIQEAKREATHMVVFAANLWSLCKNKSHNWQDIDQVLVTVEELIKVIAEKDKAYGQANRRHGLPGLLPRLWDKIARFTNLADGTVTTSLEPLEDSAKDLCGYSIIALGYLIEMEYRSSLARYKATLN